MQPPLRKGRRSTIKKLQKLIKKFPKEEGKKAYLPLKDPPKLPEKNAQEILEKTPEKNRFSKSSMEKKLYAFFTKKVVLPEKASVQISFIVNALGKVEKILEITSTSEKNRMYVEDLLREITLPFCNQYYLETPVSFTIVLY